MLTFLAENIATIIIALVVAAAVALVVRKMVRDKREGRSGCGCGCSGCGLSSACHSRRPLKKRD